MKNLKNELWILSCRWFMFRSFADSPLGSSLKIWWNVNFGGQVPPFKLCSLMRFSVCIINLVRKNLLISPLVTRRGCCTGWSTQLVYVLGTNRSVVENIYCGTARDVSTLSILHSSKSSVSGSRTYFGFWDKMRCDKRFAFNDGWKWHLKHFFT